MLPGCRRHKRQDDNTGKITPTSPSSHLLAVGALAGSASFLLHSWVEFNWQIPANALTFVFLLVLMGTLGKSPASSTPR